MFEACDHLVIPGRLTWRNGTNEAVPCRIGATAVTRLPVTPSAPPPRLPGILFLFHLTPSSGISACYTSSYPNRFAGTARALRAAHLRHMDATRSSVDEVTADGSSPYRGEAEISKLDRERLFVTLPCYSILTQTSSRRQPSQSFAGPRGAPRAHHRSRPTSRNERNSRHRAQHVKALREEPPARPSAEAPLTGPRRRRRASDHLGPSPDRQHLGGGS